ncbi:hypothetical protein [Pseudomonas capsici]|uniref:hypothetical protein n=1 Tax=Pseudomonas capsici TaxID=2810614 RepID=UPI0021F23BC8|nr:hypothetical protein [Pseudomonas capsici]MCV4343297.1 hypothetical protein [Pseudomonas capsici]
MTKVREQFESRYPVPTGVRWNEETKRYALVEIKTARHAGSTVAGYEAYVHSWSVWKASRGDVMVVIPPFDDYPASIERDVREALRTAVESAGLRVSP